MLLSVPPRIEESSAYRLERTHSCSSALPPISMSLRHRSVHAAAWSASTALQPRAAAAWDAATADGSGFGRRQRGVDADELGQLVGGAARDREPEGVRRRQVLRLRAAR